MRKILSVIFVFVTLLSFGQSFEGVLTYSTDFDVSEKLLKMGLTKQKMLDKMKKEGSWSDTIKISYKKGNYYTLYYNNPKSWSIYKADKNKIYSMQAGEASDICTVTDASIDLEFTMTGKMPTINKLDTIVNVNGVNCSIIRVKWNSGIYDYYYNQTKFNVDPILFSNHIFDGWAEFLKISKALPVKIVKTTKGMMTISMTLISSSIEVVDEKIFSIPNLLTDKNLNIVKKANVEVMRIKK
jgi:hypothetical protein